MTIQLKPEQEKFIKAQVASGKYNSPKEVMDKIFLVFGILQSEIDVEDLDIDTGELAA